MMTNFAFNCVGWFMLSRQFGRRSRITHCPARLEAAGVHVGKHGTLELENAERQHVYDEIHASLHDNGLELGNTITQGLSMNDLFQVCGYALFVCLLAAQPAWQTMKLQFCFVAVFVSGSGLFWISHVSILCHHSYFAGTDSRDVAALPFE